MTERPIWDDLVERGTARIHADPGISDQAWAIELKVKERRASLEPLKYIRLDDDWALPVLHTSSQKARWAT